VSVLVVGLSHRSASVALLERVAVGVADDALLPVLRAEPALAEAVVLATCNRVEVYADADGFHAGLEAISRALSALSGVPLEELSAHLYVHYEDRAVRHLFDVACGLDSMVVGESQILGQLRRAYASASDGAGRTLHELFQQALKVGKRAHTETGIDQAGRSLVSVGLERAMAAVGPLEGRQVLVVGAGSMGALAGATLRRAGAGGVVVANRTAGNALRLATALEGRGIGLDGLESALVEADVVVSSTGATGMVVSFALLRRAVEARGGRPIAILDLALPRDIDPAVRTLPGVTLVDLASLQAVLATTEAGAGVEATRRIVAEEVEQFLAWQRGVRVAPTVVALRARADAVVDSELARLSSRLPALDEQAAAEVRSTVRRAVAALLHAPTVRVKQLGESPDGLTYADALRALFALDDDDARLPPPVAGSVSEALRGAGDRPLAEPARRAEAAQPAGRP